jgi:hypothetical protein
VWTDEHRQRGPMPQGSSDLDIEIYETIGDFLGHDEDAQAPWFSGRMNDEMTMNLRERWEPPRGSRAIVCRSDGGEHMADDPL